MVSYMKCDLLEELNIDPDKPSFQISCLDVSEVDRMYQDIPEAYRVYISDNVDGGCLVYGLYHDNWKINPSSQRHLIKSLINLINFK